ncbi:MULTISPECIES: GlsB/YeaQ/YmgE family stress response membrane protein [Pantoea]|uniref:GlsB/YeaQ/YmgE family stress response membrane protein n=1 Tax=Pantoea TaxID=53335 RepID=UPI0006615757|nr:MULTISPECIES: GlsB/YeaQ/YmgE family stress response membrane protein [Pantoea]MBS6437320.1 GlsB/YeaQ/YmgE family stress response membrane protein [Pantoea sp.]MDU1574639.1 GlsB/YeaQ/YmgE family stress response membrane protein [Pantoea sp.]MDU2729676.1 GlsB/YeaQ/YmgE family stress response membrane protein [Pantoea sp.]MDU5472226.1 GlsB/YeaQ/YmgE family stress response membrane protein [Pantoea sp.]HAB74536.1 GlsB/YeaQ/YmgE family stress response membrane protein [Pantoea sp.]
MGILSWIFFGLVAGILARCIMPGKEHLGIIMTILLGVTGALIGGVISTALGFGKVSGFNLYSILISTAGAIIVLFVVHKIRALKQA